MKLLNPIIITLLICLSCCSSPERKLLNHIDNLINQHPDSALQLLKTVDTKSLIKSEQPFYALLLTQALIESGEQVSSDSTLSIAIEKYGLQHNERGIRSNLYAGDIFLNQESTGKAMNHYLRAYEESKRLNNDYWRARSALRIKDLFINAQNNYKALIFSIEASTLLKKLNLVKEHRNELLNQAGLQMQNRSTSRSVELLDSLRSVCAEEPGTDTLFLKQVEWNLKQDSIISLRVSEFNQQYGIENDTREKGRKMIFEANESEHDFYNDISVKNADNYQLFRTLLRLSIIISVIIISGVIIIFYFRTKAQKAKLSAYLESFLSMKRNSEQMSLEIDKNTGTINRLKIELEEKNMQVSAHNLIVRKLLSEKWNTLGMLCDQLFDLEQSDFERKRVVKNLEKELQKIVSPRGLSETIESVDKYMDGLISRLRQQCPFLKEADIEMLGLLFAGFSVRTICMFTGLEYRNFYVKKSRLIKRIQNSDAPDKELFIGLLSKRQKDEL